MDISFLYISMKEVCDRVSEIVQAFFVLPCDRREMEISQSFVIFPCNKVVEFYQPFLLFLYC